VKRVVFADSWKGKFQELGLESFDDFFNYSKGEIINKNKRRDVRRISFGSETGRGIFFLKRFHRPYLKDIIFASYNAGHRCSQSAYESENANLLFSKGIDTYRPVCTGEQFLCGIERNSFLLTEKVRSQEFKDFVAQKWNQLDEQAKKDIIVELGRFIRKIHKAGISLPDLYVWHFFIKQNSCGNWQFTVIDLHRMGRNITDKNKLIQNLGRLDHSMLDEYFDDAIRTLLVEAYAEDSRGEDIDSLNKKVRRFSAAVSTKRNPKPY